MKRKFSISFYFQGHSVDRGIIECRECLISENAYTFWGGEIGETNYIIASYPIKCTIIKDITNENKSDI
jgi:hypothetical protein